MFGKRCLDHAGGGHWVMRTDVNACDEILAALDEAGSGGDGATTSAWI